VALLIRDLPSTGDEWRELREAAGLTVQELAGETSLKTDTIRKLEAGGQVIASIRKLVAVALGVPVFADRDREEP
jgi:transcriptional regulator with XRE-family HTH domain